YAQFLRDSENYKNTEKCVARLVDVETSDWIWDDRTSITNENELEDFKAEVKGKRADLFRRFELDDNMYDEDYFFDTEKWQELMEENRLNSKTELRPIDRQKRNDDDNASVDREIEELFTGEFNEV